MSNPVTIEIKQNRHSAIALLEDMGYIVSEYFWFGSSFTELEKMVDEILYV